MKVTLIDYTGAGREDAQTYAALLLIFTKETRLKMDPNRLNFMEANLNTDQINEQLRYMANTIPSSWEFVDYTFCIEGVSRGFTHQWVRSRTMSHAQQTMRILDVSEGKGWGFHTGPTIAEDEQKAFVYEHTMQVIDDAYKALIADGAAIEDARGLLPTNIHTNIVSKMNLRTLVSLVRKRTSPRVQGEYRDVLTAIQAAVLEVHPWVSLFIERDADAAGKELDEAITKLWIQKSLTSEQANQMHKAVDKLRQNGVE